MKAFWMLVTSVVMRVTRPGTLNLSMLEKENVWMLSYSPWRRLADRPDAAVEANLPAAAPKTRPKKASTTMMAP